MAVCTSVLTSSSPSTDTTTPMPDVPKPRPSPRNALAPTNVTRPQSVPNVIPPIHTLPVEIMTCIFLERARDLRLCQCDDKSYVYPGDDYVEPEFGVGWANVMLVCQRWRNIGLHTPRLWRSVHVTANQNALELQLARSRPSKIDVFFSARACSNADAIPMLLAETGRMRLISQYGEMGELLVSLLNRHPNPLTQLLRFIKPLFAHSLPNLENLILFPFSVNEDDEHVGDGDFDLGLTDALQPRIRAFSCGRIRLPQAVSFWTSLRDLQIRIPHRGVARPYPADNLLRILSNVSDLENLDLSIAGACFLSSSTGPDDPTTDALDKINFPRLRKVELNGPHVFVGTIMQHIRLAPSLQELRIHTGLSLNETHTIGRSFQKLLLPIAGHLISRFGRLNLNLAPRDMVAITDDRSRTSRFKLQLVLPLDVGTNSAAAFDILCHAFPDAPLKYLELHTCSDDIPLDEWARLLTTFPSLHTLEMTDATLPAVHSALAVLATRIDGCILPQHPCTFIIEKIAYMSSTLHSHELIRHLMHVVAVRLAEGTHLALRMRLDIQYSSMGPAHRYRRVAPHFKMHRWLLYALARQCNLQLEFYDMGNRMGLQCLFSKEELARVVADFKAMRTSDTSSIVG